MKHFIVAGLLIAAVGVEWISCLGLMRMRNPYDRLHAASPACILPPILLAAAVCMESGFSQSAIKVLLIGASVVFCSPIVTHVVARAAWLRKRRHREK